MNDARLIFQCNANANTGLGHLSRCLNIAIAVKALATNLSIIFAGEFNDFAQTLLAQQHITVQSKNRLLLTGYDSLIVDDYDLTQNDINALRRQVACLIKIDDFNSLDLTALDLVINFRLNAQTECYHNAQQCLGLGYFPFNPALSAIRDRNLKPSDLPLDEWKTLFVFIGGHDTSGAGEKLINLINEIVTDKQLYLVAANASALTPAISSHNQIHYLPLTTNMAQYYGQADLFISGGGLSKYEVGFCAIPNAAISQNQGQAQDTQILAAHQLTFDLGLSDMLTQQPQQVRTALQQFFSHHVLKSIKQSCTTLFNSQSTQALANAILQVSSMSLFNQKRTEWEQQAKVADATAQVCRPMDQQAWTDLVADISNKLALTEQSQTNMSLLDVGCGNGLVLARLKSHFSSLYGVDYGQNMIEQAVKNLPKGVFSQGEASKLDFTDGFFERVLCYSIFHYFPDQGYVYQAIDEMIRVCQPGGLILVGDLLDNTFEQAIKSASDLDYEQTLPYIMRYSQWTFCDLSAIKEHYQQQGFRVEVLKQPDHFQLSHYRKDLRIWR